MKTNCQWCETEVNATPELIQKARLGDAIIVCHLCRAEIAKNKREAEEYEQLYAAQMTRLNALHSKGVTL